jgi:putative CocE/NonD family hydrolase
LTKARRSTFKVAPIFLFAISCSSSAPLTPAATTNEHNGIVLPTGGRRIEHAQVRMRDGARLDTDVYLPASAGRFPVVLIRTPYKTEIDERPMFLNRVLEAGYAIVQQHERGRFLSEGEMRMLGRADEDGWDALDWIAMQDWSNGRVATYGCSSSAENQLKLASLGHPAHKAMIAYSAGVGVAEAGPFREQGTFWRGGVWQQGWANYFFEEMPIAWPQLPRGLSDAGRQALAKAFAIENGSVDFDTKVYDGARMHLPMIDMTKAVGAPDTELEEYLRRGPSHPDWDDDRVTNADVIKVPGLWAEALYDISARSTVAFFEKTRKDNPAGRQAIVITNGQHCGFGRETAATRSGDRDLGDARFDYIGRQIAWLDRWLKDNGAAPVPARPITVYMAGVDRWADFDAVPWAGRDPSRVFYLSSGGRANTLNGNGRLLDSPPAMASSDTFAYDPARPVIAHGGEISGVGTDQESNDGAYDQRPIEARDDVLVYTSAALAEDLAVFGYVESELFVSSSAPDTDFTIKLVDVAPDGTAWNISDTIQRMRYRDGDDKQVFMKRGETYRITPPAMLVANVFLKGHRVRIEVSSSNFPSYARNLNTANDPYTSTEIAVARNTVAGGAGTLSSITLPVVSPALRAAGASAATRDSSQ